MDMTLSLLPVQPGLQVATHSLAYNIALSVSIIPPSHLQALSPLLFVDVLSNQKKYHFNKLGQVYVEIQSAETLSSA